MSYSYSWANSFNYNHIETFSDFDAIFVLTNTLDNSQYAKLDCQSFFHKFDIYTKENKIISENYISFGECEYLYKNINKCLNHEKIKCINSEALFNLDCQCP